MKKIEQLELVIQKQLNNCITSIIVKYDEITIIVDPVNIITVLTILKEHDDTKFEQCVDLCGVDYSQYNYKDELSSRYRFAVVYHLLSITYNWRIRVKSFLLDNDFPEISTSTNIWNGLDWFEREAFDLFGIIFVGHNDLRRILTDYGFIGYPLRKDFPLSGDIEMKYDENLKRIVYQPVTIEPRNLKPKVFRKNYHND